MFIRKLLSFVVAGILTIGVPTATHAATSITILHAFGSSDAAHPRAGLVADGTGNLYGTTYTGGTWGHGTVFMLIKNQGYAEAVLHSFGSSPNASDGANPQSQLLIDTHGNVYGTTTYREGTTSSSDGQCFRASGHGEAGGYRNAKYGDPGRPFGIRIRTADRRSGQQDALRPGKASQMLGTAIAHRHNTGSSSSPRSNVYLERDRRPSLA